MLPRYKLSKQMPSRSNSRFQLPSQVKLADG
jgi:hypothetical protein